jgi:type III restriction enzyme
MNRHVNAIAGRLSLRPPQRHSPEIITVKKNSAVRWCQNATKHAANNGGKPWKYLLIPHDAIAENMSIKGLDAQFCA